MKFQVALHYFEVIRGEGNRCICFLWNFYMFGVVLEKAFLGKERRFG